MTDYEMTKEQAAKYLRDLAKRVYEKGAKWRTEIDFTEASAFHVVQMRLNALAAEFGALDVPVQTWPYYYPIITDTDGRFWVSNNYFWKWVNSYLPIMRRVAVLKPIADAHDANVEFARDCREAWEHLVTFYGEEGERMYPAKVQDLWDSLQLRQLEIFQGVNDEQQAH